MIGGGEIEEGNSSRGNGDFDGESGGAAAAVDVPNSGEQSRRFVQHSAEKGTTVERQLVASGHILILSEPIQWRKDASRGEV